MYKTLIFKKPVDKTAQIIEKFNVNKIYENERTSIYENKELRLSFDTSVIRALVFNEKNKELINSLENYFYYELEDY